MHLIFGKGKHFCVIGWLGKGMICESNGQVAAFVSTAYMIIKIPIRKYINTRRKPPNLLAWGFFSFVKLSTVFNHSRSGMINYWCDTAVQSWCSGPSSRLQRNFSLEKSFSIINLFPQERWHLINAELSVRSNKYKQVLYKKGYSCWPRLWDIAPLGSQFPVLVQNCKLHDMEKSSNVIDLTNSIKSRTDSLIKLHQILEVDSIVETLENWLHHQSKELRLLKEQISFTAKVVEESS